MWSFWWQGHIWNHCETARIRQVIISVEFEMVLVWQLLTEGNANQAERQSSASGRHDVALPPMHRHCTVVQMLRTVWYLHEQERGVVALVLWRCGVSPHGPGVNPVTRNPVIAQDVGKRGVEFKGGSLHEDFGSFDDFGSSPFACLIEYSTMRQPWRFWRLWRFRRSWRFKSWRLPALPVILNLTQGKSPNSENVIWLQNRLGPNCPLFKSYTV